MEKSVFTPLYGRFREKLRELRKAAGLNQRELAARLEREHSFVGRIELGERRLDVVEFFWLCRACGYDPAKACVELMADFAKLEPKPRPKRRR